MKKLIRNLKENIRILLKPSYWIMNNTYSKNWDNKLNYLLDNYDFEYIDPYISKLGNIIIWTTNHPYASFKPRNSDIRASRKTIYKANKKYKKTILKQNV